MTSLLIPVVGVVFAFLISVLSDIRLYHKLDWTKFTSHSTKMAMYLATIGVLEVVGLKDPAIAAQVRHFSYIFAGGEILGAFGTMQAALKGQQPPTQPDPLAEALQKDNPFNILK